MIQINHVGVKKIAQEHYEAISPDVIKKLNFCITILDAFISKKPKSKVGKDIHSSTKIALLKVLFFNSKTANEKIENLINSNAKPKKNDTKKDQSGLLNLLTDIKKEIDTFLIGMPKDSKIASDDIDKKHAVYLKKNKQLIDKIFDYDKLTDKGFGNGKDKWTNYTLTAALEAKTCFYCNRHHTFTIMNESGNKKGSPTLDHFFDKATYPLLQLNFYNLIPSCYTCNSICKGSIPFDLDNNIHPYEDDFGDKVKFRWRPKDVNAAQGFNENNEVFFDFPSDVPVDDRKKIEKNIEIFGLDVAYNTHSDIVQELIMKKQRYPDRYLDMIMNFFDGSMSNDEAYRLAFGNYYSKDEHHKRPLAKFTRDIAEDLGL